MDKNWNKNREKHAESPAWSEKEKRIFKAVLALADRGVDMRTVKMQEIAAEADFGKSTLYEYFPSKEELLLETMRYCLQQESAFFLPKVESCRSFSQLTEVLLDYLDQLVRERASSYRMLVQVFGGQGGQNSCPFSGKAFAVFQRMARYSHELARQEGLAVDMEENYFHFVLLSALLNHGVALLRMKNDRILTRENKQRLDGYTRRLLYASLRPD